MPAFLSPMLAGRRVVLGVCGGIAAYKAVELCRRLGDSGALVTPVLTEAATRFVGALTFSALADEPAQVSLFPTGHPETARGGAHPVPHIDLARRADAVVVAPATARLLGAYAHGLSSDLLSALLIATGAPVLVCPAMHAEMWEHPAVQDNVALLRARGTRVLEPVQGRLAGGDYGTGRLPEAADILEALEALLSQTAPEQLGPAGPRSLSGTRAVVSAGGTREPIDAVRYISNRSSGKQGYAVAAALAARGAEVVLVSSSELAPPPGVRMVAVETAAQMAEVVLAEAEHASVVVMVAAVADYRPEQAAAGKLKKGPAPVDLRLLPTQDILRELGARRRPGQVLVGFAAEAASGLQLVELARAKLVAKGADLVVANDISRTDAGFGSDRNAAVMVSDASHIDLGLADKAAVAAKVVDAVEGLLQGRPPAGPQQ